MPFDVYLLTHAFFFKLSLTALCLLFIQVIHLIFVKLLTLLMVLGCSIFCMPYNQVKKQSLRYWQLSASAKKEVLGVYGKAATSAGRPSDNKRIVGIDGGGLAKKSNVSLKLFWWLHRSTSRGGRKGSKACP